MSNRNVNEQHVEASGSSLKDNIHFFLPFVKFSVKMSAITWGTVVKKIFGDIKVGVISLISPFDYECSLDAGGLSLGSEKCHRKRK
jgi:hypothetical protein